ncbi:A/G-specific adenine glycosylase [Silanimonas algicola]
MSRRDFAERLLDWYDRHGRHDLPWQHPRTPYRVWISEVMLQQTQVQTVIGYFSRFLSRFPDLASLAAADEDEVLALWSGLGYYSRARNLHRAARACMDRHQGKLPEGIDALSALPGIGRSTAAAILAQAHGQRHAILDGNVKRVLARLLGEAEWPGKSTVERRLWSEAEARLPASRLPDYTQALMDFGATHCTARKPRCGDCPLQDDCRAYAEKRVDLVPARKPAKATPTRAVRLLVIRDEAGRVLLHRRTGRGVWQGLWSVPEASDEDAARELAATLGIDDGVALPAFVHAFSHYRLQASPTLHRVRGAPPPWPPGTGAGDAPEQHRWIEPADYDSVGLPRPIRTLLESLP